MATVACPGCGLPRVESELGATPCPVCDAPPVAAPRAKPKPHAPDPTAGMPADASQLDAHPPSRSRAPGGARAVGAVAFVLGALCGVGGVLAVQAIEWPRGEAAAEVAAVAPAPSSGWAADTSPPAAKADIKPEVAPMPHEPAAKPTAPDPEPDAEPKALQPPPPAGRVTTIELNQPDTPFAVPFPMKKGEHVVLRGKAKSLRVSGLDGGSTLDASALEIASASVSTVDGRSTLKLRAPLVAVTGRVSGGSAVEIDAPGGEVKFSYPSTPARDGSKIDGGARVSITARVVEFKADISGDGTKVSVLLTRSAWLKFASLGGKAVLEYKSQAAGWSPPDVIPGAVAPGATFRLIENER